MQLRAPFTTLDGADEWPGRSGQRARTGPGSWHGPPSATPGIDLRFPSLRRANKVLSPPELLGLQLAYNRTFSFASAFPVLERVEGDLDVSFETGTLDADAEAAFAAVVVTRERSIVGADTDACL